MIQLPGKSKIWTQPNISTVLGSLASTFNIDPQTNLGKLRTTGMIQTTFEATNTDMTDPPLKFVNYNGSIWTVAGTKVHKTAIGDDDPMDPFVVDAISGSPTTLSFSHSDIEAFNGRVYVTGVVASFGNLYRTNATTWTDLGALSSTGPFRLCAYANRLYIQVGSNEIHSMNTSETIATSGQYTIDFADNGTSNITFIKAGADKIWVGMRTSDGQPGIIYEWDGSSNQATRSYKISARSPLSCVMKDDVPYVMDNQGRLLVFNGGAFVEVARLPLFDKILEGSYGSEKWIHSNGMSLINGKVNMLIRNTLEDTSTPEFCMSGIWEYDERMGLYHKHSLSYTPIGTTTITSWGQGRLAKVGGLNEMRTGDTGAGANGYFLAGAETYLTATTSSCGVFINDYLDTTQKAGYIVTPELSGEGISDIMQKVYANYRRLLASGDKIVVKYRTSKQEPTEMTITWTSTTTFTTTDSNMANYAVGDEVEITRGKGGGMCSHITVISNNAGTYTVTVDETHTGATSGTATARFQKWIKAGSITDIVSAYKEFPIGLEATWIQFKVFFLWTGKNEFEKLTLVHEPQQKPL